MANRGTGKPTRRLFVALDPPRAVCDEVAAWGRQVAGPVRGMRAVPAANCHITLAFIGEASESEAAIIGAAVERSAVPVSGLSLGAPVLLPRRRPRALALEVHDNHGELRECHERLAGNLADDIGWQPARRFRPHLTAARLSRGVDPALHPFPVSPAVEFSGEAVTLYRSRLLPEGASYEALVRAEL